MNVAQVFGNGYLFFRFSSGLTYMICIMCSVYIAMWRNKSDTSHHLERDVIYFFQNVTEHEVEDCADGRK